MKDLRFRRAIVRRVASLAILTSFAFSNAFAVAMSTASGDVHVVLSDTTAKYTTDLTQLGREGRLQENLNLESETVRVIKMLSEGGMRQPVVVSEDKAVQNGVVDQLAMR